MKKKLIYGMMLTSMFFLGCNDEFLEGEQTNVLTSETIADHSDNYPALLEGSLNGITSFIIEPFAVTGTRHFDFGQKAVDIWMDMTCGDMALSTSAYGWYNDAANLIAPVDFTQEENEIIWIYYYRIISVANTVISSIGGNDVVPENDESKRILGQAKTYRAYAYFYLLQLYQRSYDPAQEVLPFYNIDTFSLAKVPAGDIYDQVVSDLTHAIELLDGYTRPAKNLIDKTVAQGFLAYTYAAMGMYPEAKVQADNLISAYSPTTAGQLVFPGAGSGFNDVNTASWIWGYDLTEDLGHQLIDWWGQVDPFTYSYAWAGDSKSIDDLLYSQIPEGDVRKDQFATATGALQPINKFFDPGRTIGGQYIITTDLIHMRVEEFILLSAESAAKSGAAGGEATAKTMMIDFLTPRVGAAEASATITPLSGQALLDEIYLQTRIELWGEGKSYLAMKRNQATVTRGTNHVYRSGESFAYDSDEMSFQIPEVEIINNGLINGQN